MILNSIEEFLIVKLSTKYSTKTIIYELHQQNDKECKNS